MSQRTRRRVKRNGGTKSIIRRSPSSSEKQSVKTRKTVRWHPEVKNPKKKLGRTRSQTQNSLK